MKDLGRDGPFFASEDVAHSSSFDFSLGVFEEFGHFDVVGDDGALLDGSHDERHVHPRIVVLSCASGESADSSAKWEGRTNRRSRLQHHRDLRA